MVARRRSEDALLTIQGALVLARARDDAKIFSRAMAELQARLLAPVALTSAFPIPPDRVPHITTVTVFDSAEILA